jgi:hypothetical protein
LQKEKFHADKYNTTGEETEREGREKERWAV